MKNFKKIILVALIVTTSSAFSQTKVKFGVDCAITDPTFQEILNDSTKDYRLFFNEFAIEKLRFPGGSPVRYFFWDNSKLSSEARKLLETYYNFRSLPKAVKKMEREIHIPKDIYRKYLQFCCRNNVTPIVQLNTIFYNDSSLLFPIEPFKKYGTQQKLTINRWEKIESNLVAQLDYTHNIIDTVFWEIGNEDYFIYEPEVYGKIVTKYIEIIKNEYPEDQIIVEMANSYWGRSNKDNWNKTLIKYLQANNILSKIDFFAPHFYNNPEEILITSKEIEIKIRETDAQKYESKMKKYFPKTYSPKFFYTEFQVFRKPNKNQHFNTQLHAMEMFYFMMRFAGSKNLYGVIHHCFTSNACGLFFDKKYLDRYPYMKDANKKSTYFAYISPQAKAIKLFYETCGDSILDFHANENYLTLLSKDSNGKYLQILNFSSNEIRIEPLHILPLGIESVIKSKYLFSELNSHQWNINTTIMEEDGLQNSFRLEAYSLLTIQF